MNWAKIQSVVTTMSLVFLCFVAGFAYTTSKRQAHSDTAYWVGCLAAWGDASSQRSSVLDRTSKWRDFQRGKRDAAMAILVANRGGPNTRTTDQAKADYHTADVAALKAEAEFNQSRNDYPPPKLKNYCTRLKSVRLPKAVGTPSVPHEDARDQTRKP